MNLTELRDLDRYLAAVRIETDDEPKPWGGVADDWQRVRIEGIASALRKLVVSGAPDPEQRRALWISPRGHAKTADAAMLVAYVLAFSRRRRRGVWVAADKQQGCEGLDAIATLCRHNPWLDSLLTIRVDKCENERTGSTMYFTTSDVLSAYGWKDADTFVLDEISHWPAAKSEQLWTAMYSAAAKRRNAVVLAMGNAGFAGTWQENLRNAAQADPAWAFDELPDAVASWIDLDRLRDQQRYIPQAAFDRLWRNRWSSSGGDALLPEHVERAFDATLAPMSGKQPGWMFVLGCDLGLTRDFSACVTLAVPTRPEGPAKIRLADAKLWRPPANGKINLLEIAAYILKQDEKFGLENVVLDAWQAEHLGQTLELTTTHHRRNQSRRFGRTPWVEAVQPTTATLRQQASLVIESFTDDRLAFYPCEPLRRDLLNLRAVEQPTGGFRLTSPRTAETGHGDTASAFMLALAKAHALATEWRGGANSLFLSADSVIESDPRPAWLAAAEAEIRAREAERQFIESLPADNPLNDYVYQASGGRRGRSPFG